MNRNIYLFNKALKGFESCYRMCFRLVYQDKVLIVHRKSNKMVFYRNSYKEPFLNVEYQKGIKMLSHLVPLLERSSFVTRKKEYDNGQLIRVVLEIK